MKTLLAFVALTGLIGSCTTKDRLEKLNAGKPRQVFTPAEFTFTEGEVRDGAWHFRSGELWQPACIVATVPTSLPAKVAITAVVELRGEFSGSVPKDRPEQQLFSLESLDDAGFDLYKSARPSDFGEVLTKGEHDDGDLEISVASKGKVTISSKPYETKADLDEISFGLCQFRPGVTVSVTSIKLLMEKVGDGSSSN